MRINRILSLVVLVAAAGCGPTWVVLRQAEPNPMAGQRTFAIEQVSYENLQVGEKDEATYLSEKTPEQIASYGRDKADGAGHFAAQLAAEIRGIGGEVASGPGANVFIVRPHVTHYEPGSFNGFVNFPTEVVMTVDFTSADGTPLDQVNFKGVVHADIYHPSSGQRLRDAMTNIGRQVAAYLRTRTTVYR